MDGRVPVTNYLVRSGRKTATNAVGSDDDDFTIDDRDGTYRDNANRKPSLLIAY